MNKILDWEHYLRTAADVAAEGIVMLRNENDEYYLYSVDEKGNAGWLLKQDAFKKLFVQWR